MEGKTRLLLVLCTIILSVVLFSRCMNTGDNSSGELTASDSTSANSTTCVKCHKNIYDNYLKSPHFNTSKPVEHFSLFEADSSLSNGYQFDEHLKIAVEKRDTGMYQAVYIDGELQFSRKFDVAIGSGKNAHTYGSWKGNHLTQLQLSYFKEINNWANSPGYADNKIYFSRNIDARCLACHASNAEEETSVSGGLETSKQLLKSSLVYGIDCERCHGPAGKHVAFHLKNPQDKVAKFMVRYKQLTRKQKVDACAICHSGSDREQLRSTFAFKPGDDIDQFFNANAAVVSDPDVHGQQFQMLSASACYVKSNTMDCSTCHSMHPEAQTGLTAYSKKCISCHQNVNHSAATLKNAMVKTNCIDCHMPLQASKAISFKAAGEKRPNEYRLRTHKIAVYPIQTKVHP